MLNSTHDWRKLRSRQYIIDAFLELMEKKEFEKITVSDIIKKAHVSRSTFYAQFEDKYDFANQITEDVLSELRRYVLPASSQESSLIKESQIYYQYHFEYIYHHARFFKIMLGPHGTPIFRQKLEESAFLTYEKIFENFHYDTLSVSLGYLIPYIVCAHIGLTLKWVRSGLTESPDTMAKVLTNLTFNGLLHGLGLDTKVILPK